MSSTSTASEGQPVFLLLHLHISHLDQYPDELLAAVLPDVGVQPRREVFTDITNTEGSFEAALAYVKGIHEVVLSGAAMGLRPTSSLGCVPPTNAEVKSSDSDVGPFKFFYHSLYPSHLQDSNSPSRGILCWPARARHLLDYARLGAPRHCRQDSGFGRECQALMILPFTRVRISYRDSNGTQLTREQCQSVRDSDRLRPPDSAQQYPPRKNEILSKGADAYLFA
ncbi:hypothetical protein B0H13DRAFT_1935656 [Mycena leptocephala]|nr:hypothetical protein B0H13DRAFT_1935656 [Mycena leptocephala]